MDESTKKWLNWMLLTSVPLRRLDNNNLPIEIASGCLIDYGGKRFLLSVQHAVDMQSSSWVVEVRYDPSRGTEIYKPIHFNYVGEVKLGEGRIRDIDFCYTEVPVDFSTYYQHITPIGGTLEERPRHVFNTNLFLRPNHEAIYAFSGQVMPDMCADQALLIEMRVYPGLRYLRDEGPYHVFKLPVAHPGHDHFRGCSGAPIVDTKGNVSALVCDGDADEDIIRGVSISRYKLAFDIIAGLVCV